MGVEIEDADLTAGHHTDKHHLSDDQVREALLDPNRLIDDPGDSDSGMTIDVFGYSYTRGRVLRVIVVREEDGYLWVVTAYPARKPQVKRYSEEGRP